MLAANRPTSCGPSCGLFLRSLAARDGPRWPWMAGVQEMQEQFPSDGHGWPEWRKCRSNFLPMAMDGRSAGNAGAISCRLAAIVAAIASSSIRLPTCSYAERDLRAALISARANSRGARRATQPDMGARHACLRPWMAGVQEMQEQFPAEAMDGRVRAGPWRASRAGYSAQRSKRCANPGWAFFRLPFFTQIKKGSSERPQADLKPSQQSEAKAPHPPSAPSPEIGEGKARCSARSQADRKDLMLVSCS